MAETTQLLQRWRDGDESVVGQILADHLSWLRQQVREHLGLALRQKLTSEDVVQEALVDFLNNGPRFVPADTVQLRALLARIVANAVSDQGNWFRAARRRMSAELPIDPGDEPIESATDGQPDATAIAREQATRLRLAMELLEERDRRLLVWSKWEQLPFAEIGARLGLDAEAARGATRRAIERLRDTMTRLRHGDVDGALRTAVT
jgi:RNA polymerase sigma factor (sigma-70 family)